MESAENLGQTIPDQFTPIRGGFIINFLRIYVRWRYYSVSSIYFLVRLLFNRESFRPLTRF